jgi:hypothetical protein
MTPKKLGIGTILLAVVAASSAPAASQPKEKPAKSRNMIRTRGFKGIFDDYKTIVCPKKPVKGEKR